MRITFAAIPAFGHVYPLMPLALACRAVGNEVAVATGPPFIDSLPLPTMLNQPAELSVWRAGRLAIQRLAESERATGIPSPRPGSLKFEVDIFANTMAPQVRSTLREQWSVDRPELVVWESINVGAAQAAHDLGIRATPFAITLTGAYTPALLQAAGLDRPDSVIDPFPPAWRLDDPPLGRDRVDIQTTAWNQPARVPPGWSDAGRPRPRSRPRIYVTLGTAARAWGGLGALRRVIAEVGVLDADVLVAAESIGDLPLSEDLPSNVRVERFVDQAAVVPLADVIVHHGGTGTLMAAFAAGVPQVIIPLGSDQFMNAERVIELNLGQVVPTDADDGVIASAICRVLDGSFDCSRARKIRDQILCAPTPLEVARQLCGV